MKVPYIIGADLSKKSIDFATHPLNAHLKISNDPQGYQELLKWLKAQFLDVSKVLIVMEHTGLYSFQLENYLHQQDIRFSKVSGLAIKRSMGLVRGKTDKQDAIRIARYGFEKRDLLVIGQPMNQNLQRLQMLHSIRERLVGNRASLITAVKELQHGYQLKQSDIIISSQLKLIKSFDQQIQKLDKAIEAIVEAEKNIKEITTYFNPLKA